MATTTSLAVSCHTLECQQATRGTAAVHCCYHNRLGVTHRSQRGPWGTPPACSSSRCFRPPLPPSAARTLIFSQFARNQPPPPPPPLPLVSLFAAFPRLLSPPILAPPVALLSVDNAHPLEPVADPNRFSLFFIANSISGIKGIKISELN